MPHFDVLLLGGTVIDGSGATRRLADVGFAGDRIAAVGSLAAAVPGESPAAGRVVDARGMVVHGLHRCP